MTICVDGGGRGNGRSYLGPCVYARKGERQLEEEKEKKGISVPIVNPH